MGFRSLDRSSFVHQMDELVTILNQTTTILSLQAKWRIQHNRFTTPSAIVLHKCVLLWGHVHRVPVENVNIVWLPNKVDIRVRWATVAGSCFLYGRRQSICLRIERDARTRGRGECCVSQASAAIQFVWKELCLNFVCRWHGRDIYVWMLRSHLSTWFKFQ